MTSVKEEKLALVIPDKHAWKQIPNDIKHIVVTPTKISKKSKGT
jgi:hypothetical protein